MAVHNVVLVSEQSRTVNDVSNALSSNGRLNPDDILRDLPALMARLEKGPSPAVLVDIDALPAYALASLEPLIKRFPETRFIVLAEDLKSELLLQALQVGARHVMRKKEISRELSSAIHRLCPAQDDYRLGSIVTVFSAGGGCGSTTLAVNLANELQLDSSERALLIDLDTAYSTVASYLGLQGQFGLMDVLGRTGTIDPELIASTTIAYSPTLHVLPTSATSTLPLEPLTMTPRLPEMLFAARQGYRYTVIDAPRLNRKIAAELARESNAVLIVMQLSIKDLRVARLMMQDLLDNGIESDKLIPVISRYRRRTSVIEPEEAQRALGRDALEMLSNDFTSASQAINYGQPLSQSAPRSLLRREIQNLSAVLLRKHLAASEERTKGR